MSLTAPEIVIACPHCAATCRVVAPTDQEPMGVVSWTDGYQEVEGAPPPANITRCAACRKFYWLNHASQLGILWPPEWQAERIKIAEANKLPPPESDPRETEWWKAPKLDALDEAACFEALAAGLGETTERELELRVLAWWRGNDRFRRSVETGRYPTAPEALANVERIIELTSEGDHEMVLFRAEAHRQLGRFPEAREALYGLCSDYAAASDRVMRLIDGNSRDLDILFGEPTES